MKYKSKTIAINGGAIGTMVASIAKINNEIMKLIHVMILSILFVGASISTKAQTRKTHCNHVSVLSVKRDVFYFKVDTEFQGATAEVLDSSGKVQYSITLHKKRELIDFFYLEAGEYTIKFSRGNQVEEHHYSVTKRA